MVGISGNTAERAAEVTPKARKRLALMVDTTAAVGANVIDTCPPITSATAGAAPLYGTWLMPAPDNILNNTSAR